MKHQGTGFLKTKRLLLRPYQRADAQAMFHNWASDEEVCRHLTWPRHENVEQTQRLVDEWVDAGMNDRFYRWAITLDDELIGDIAVVRWNEEKEEVMLGYCIGSAWWGQGIMTEALPAVLDYLLYTIGFHRIMLHYDTENPASARVMEKAGLQYEGTMKAQRKRHDGTWADIGIYGAVRGEWQMPGSDMA